MRFSWRVVWWLKKQRLRLESSEDIDRQKIYIRKKNNLQCLRIRQFVVKINNLQSFIQLRPFVFVIVDIKDGFLLTTWSSEVLMMTKVSTK